jgi:propanediol dehydratase small subunit
MPCATRGILRRRGVPRDVAGGAEAGSAQGDRLRQLERELRRARRSRQVLMEVLTGIEETYRAEIGALRAENRRLRRLLARRRAALGRERLVPAAGPRLG